MKLSVIVPVYNMTADGKLTHCMDSLVNQTIAADPGVMEIIAVDDCSADESYLVLRGYEERYPGLVRAFRLPRNRHQGGAKNQGLAYASGEWIGFIDSDDWVCPDYYEKLLSAAEDIGADMAGCDYCLVDHYTFEPGEAVSNGSMKQAGMLNEDRYRSLIMDAGSLVVKIYKRHIVYGDLDKDSYRDGTYKDTPGKLRPPVPVFPEKIFYEDNAVSASWMLRARCYAYIPKPMYFYYQHDTSTVHTVTMSNLQDRVTSSRMIVEDAEEKGYLKKYYRELEFSFTMLFYVNTMFSALQEKKRIPGLYRFLKKLKEEQRKRFPDFINNEYLVRQLDSEQIGMLRLHNISQPMFWVYYRALQAYRRIRCA